MFCTHVVFCACIVYMIVYDLYCMHACIGVGGADVCICVWGENVRACIGVADVW